MRVAWVLVIAGCGRIAFDAATVCTILAGHDEDGDGVDDACDTCPHIATAQTDSDGDGVGDACDPQPAISSERIVLFDPFTGALRPEWGLVGINHPVIEGDRLHFAPPMGMSSTISLPGTPQLDVFTTGGFIVTGDPVQNRQLALAAVGNGPTTYYCELLSRTNTTKKLSYTYTFNGTDYINVDMSPLDTDLENEAFTFSMKHGPTVECSTDASPGGTVSGPAQTSIMPTDFYLFANRLEVYLDYFIQIRTE